MKVGMRLLIILGLASSMLSVSGQASGQIPSGDWIYLKNEALKVGAIKSSGAGLGYLSLAESSKNLLNHYDRGRLIQQSFYGNADGSKWRNQPWNYNPVQGGDYLGKPARLLEWKSEGKTLQAKTVPLHWATGQELSECLMEQEVSLEGPVMRIHYTFAYDGTVSHEPRHQELPAVFLDASLDTLVTYVGDAPWTKEPVARLKPGQTNEYIKISESWVAYVGAEGVGVGVYVPSVSEATCYRFRGKSGGALDCSYVAPIATFALTPGLRCSYDAYFTVGTVEEIRERFARIRQEILEGKRASELRLQSADGSAK